MPRLPLHDPRRRAERAPPKDPSPELQERMGALFEEITKAGVMLDTAGLTPTSDGTRITWSGGKLSATDGPFTETKEVVGGYAILQAKDKAEALEWTKRFLQMPRGALDGHGRGARDRRRLTAGRLPSPGCRWSDGWR